MKKCTKCQIEKSKTDFSKDKNTTDGFRAQCKQCLKETYTLNKDKISAVNKTNYNPEKKKEYYQLNTEKLNQKHKIYYEKNKDNLLLNKRMTYNKELKREYNVKNKENRNKYLKERRTTDPLYKLKINTRSAIGGSIRKQGYSKSSKTQQILGCSFEEFKVHLEKQFTKDMSWENHGEWHLDHIYPVSLATDENHLIELNHYTNFQPLWALDNIKKGNKIINKTYKSE